jgi:hypothetical protein
VGHAAAADGLWHAAADGHAAAARHADATALSAWASLLSELASEAVEGGRGGDPRRQRCVLLIEGM